MSQPNNNDVIMIELDRPRELRFGHKALKQLIALTGKSLEEIEEKFTDFEVLEAIVFCGLQHDTRQHNETLKLEDMEDLLDRAPNYVHIVERATLAFNAAFGVKPQATEGNQSAPDKPATTNGSRSTGKKADA